MAYQISNKEIVQHHFHTGLSRVLIEQVQQVESILTAYRPADYLDIIANARECVLRIHTVLQLLQPFAGKKFSAEERAFCQLKRYLSKQHEESEVFYALTKLKYLSAGADRLQLLEDAKRRHSNEKQAVPNIALQRKRFVDKVLLLLLNVQKPFQMSVPEIYDIDMFAEIITSSHQAVVAAYNDCAQTGNDADYQQLYSAINVLRYQTEVLQNFAFAPTNVKRKYLERLATKLELYNNLTTLLARLEKWQGDGLSQARFAALCEIVNPQKKVLAADLLQLGEKMLTMNFASIHQKRVNLS